MSDICKPFVTVRLSYKDITIKVSEIYKIDFRKDSKELTIELTNGVIYVDKDADYTVKAYPKLVRDLGAE